MRHTHELFLNYENGEPVRGLPSFRTVQSGLAMREADARTARVPIWNSFYRDLGIPSMQALPTSVQNLH